MAFDKGHEKLGGRIPGLQEFYGTSLAAGPDGTTLIATILNFGGHNIRRVILTYYSSS